MSRGTPFESGDGPSSGPDPQIESYVSGLQDAGYADTTVSRKRRVVAAFAEWICEEEVPVTDVDVGHVDAFLERCGRDRSGQQCALRGFIEHLREKTGVASPSPSTTQSFADTLTARYADHLRRERGLTDRSVEVYQPLIQGFLSAQEATTGTAEPAALDAHAVRQFLLGRARGRSSESSRLLATALRSFLRFLFLRGETELDLSFAVPAVRRWSQAPVHAFLSPDQVERTLLTTDRNTPRGRRDYAILLFLARLGLRAGEVVALELGDIHWRTRELVVRGKGQVLDRLPLLADVGEALAAYLQKDRGSSASRRVFLRMLAPRVGLTGPASVGHVVRLALARAGIARSQRGAAHLLRHSLATRMIRHGASIAEISEVLRHRSVGTTEIYAKVAFETLRGVARLWPSAGGGR